MSTALVTGGAGFLGTNLCRSLLEDGTNVVCLDNLGSGRRANVDHLDAYAGFSFVEGDVREPIGPQVDASLGDRNLDYVYHFASRASPTDFDDYALEIARSNTEGTRHALEVAREHDATILFASTSEVYGDPEVHPQTESYRGNVSLHGSRAPYDEAKRFGETLCTTYRREYGVDTRIVRIFNTYGPRMRPDDGRVVPTFCVQALRGTDLTVHGDGNQTRSFLFVDDLIRGVRRLAERPGLAGEVVNVGHTDEVSISEFADIVAKVASADVGVEHQPRPEDDPSRRRPDVSKAADLLDWGPTVDLETGLERTIEYFEREATDADS